MEGLETLNKLRTKNFKYLTQYEEEQFETIEKELKALVFIKSFFEIVCNGRFNSITFVNENTRIVYFCKSREEYEELRKVLA